VNSPLFEAAGRLATPSPPAPLPQRGEGKLGSGRLVCTMMWAGTRVPRSGSCRTTLAPLGERVSRRGGTGEGVAARQRGDAGRDRYF
jgi:hypothetical protein